MGKFAELLTDETLKADGIFTNFETADDAAKALKAATIKLSQKGVIIPQDVEKAKPEELDGVFAALGRPKDAAGYDLPAGSIPKGFEALQAEVDEFKEVAFKMGMSKAQFRQAFGYRVDKMLKEAKSRDEASTKARNESETNLRKQFGAKYEERIQGIQKLINVFGGGDGGATQEDVDAVIARPGLVKMLSGILDEMSEATLEKLGHSRTGAMTPDEANAKIKEIRGDAKHPYNNPGSGKLHEDAKKEMDALYKMANPGKKFL